MGNFLLGSSNVRLFTVGVVRIAAFLSTQGFIKLLSEMYDASFRLKQLIVAFACNDQNFMLFL